jgi:hypothetical protein
MDRMTERENLESTKFSIIDLTLPWPSGFTPVPHHSFLVFFYVKIISLECLFMYALSAPLRFQYSIISP